MNQSADKDNLDTNYQFILDNLEILKTDINLWNLSSKFEARSKFSIRLNQQLVNLKRQILMDVSENKHNLILFNTYQWDIISDYVNNETENV